MLPFDLVEVVKWGLAQERRPPDGLLHCSSDLIGSLRHAQLHIAGAPKLESELVSDIRLNTGTMWHNWLVEKLIARGLTVMHEVKVSPWLPEGWSGTADHLIYDDKRRAFVLNDLKTTKGEGLKWIHRDGAKEEHIWQGSAYYHALSAGKFPLLDRFTITYLPMNDTTDRDENIEPVVMEIKPLSRDLVWGVMEDRWVKTKAYLRTVGDSPLTEPVGTYVTDLLEPPIPRIQKLFWDGKNKRWDVKLVPHWSTQFCPFPEELCDCSTQGTTKIGEWRLDNQLWLDEGVLYAWDLNYHPRKGYEDIEVSVKPDDNAVHRAVRA